MKKSDQRSIIAFVIEIVIAIGVAWAGSQNGETAFGYPIFALMVAVAFIIQWIVFIPSFQQQTEKFFDLTGSLTYISLSLIGLLLAPVLSIRSILLAVLVLVWAGRLGTFLYRRIHRDGKDGRFDEIKKSALRFFNVWTIQGLWVTFTAAAAFVAITSSNQKDLDIWAAIGLIIWILGFGIEVIADNQKTAFRANPANKGKFIQTGLWAKSRHPNYFGEILLWLGVAVIAAPTFQGWQWIAIISPIFVTLLLTRVSGVPMLERRADDKWGGQEDYEAYKKNTPVLIPKIGG